MDILSYLMGKQSAGGGGGGITVGDVASVFICTIVQGVPDPSTMLIYNYEASYGTTLLTAGEGGSRADLAAGLNVKLTEFSYTIPNDPGIALYDFDTQDMTLTEIPDALTIEEYEGNVAAFGFVMPELPNVINHFAIIGIPQSDPGN